MSLMQFFSSHFPVFMVVLPLLAGPFIFLCRKPAVCLGVCLLVAFVAFFSSVVLYVGPFFSQTPVLYYAMGGWPEWIGISYQVDRVALLFLILMQFFGLLALLGVGTKEVEDGQHSFFYAAWMLAWAGFSGLLLTEDIFNMFVFLEIASLSSYLLVSFGQRPRAYVVSFNYLVIGSVAASLLLFGIGFLYVSSGILNMGDLFAYAAQSENDGLLLGVAFVMLGLFIKSALFPVHGWLPFVYGASPLSVAMFFTVASTKVSMYLLLVLMNGFYAVLAHAQWLVWVLFVAASLGVLFGNGLAGFQKGWRKIFAYSSVGQIAYALVAASAFSEASFAVSALQILAHGVSQASLWLCLMMVVGAGAGERAVDLARVFVRRPLLLAVWLLGVLGLMGVPFTFGFFAKWRLLSHLFVQGHMWGFAVVVLGSVLGLFYGYRLLKPVLLCVFGSQALDEGFHSSSNKQLLWCKRWSVLLAVVLLVNLLLAFGSGWVFRGLGA